MAVILRLPDVLVVLLEISDGPAGVLRVARIQRILRLGRFLQILRKRGEARRKPCPN
jgi:hypothetical protein